MSHFRSTSNNNGPLHGTGFRYLRDIQPIGFTNESRLFSRKENLREDKHLYVVFSNEKRVELVYIFGWRFFLPVAVAIRFDMEGRTITIVGPRSINASRKRFHSFENRWKSFLIEGAFVHNYVR